MTERVRSHFDEDIGTFAAGPKGSKIFEVLLEQVPGLVRALSNHQSVIIDGTETPHEAFCRRLSHNFIKVRS